MPRFTSFAQFSAWLAQKGVFHMDLGLERMRKALGQQPWPVIQVLGTNGKGSTATFIAALAEAHGLRVGLYTSPHFVSIRERIRVNGEAPRDDLWLRHAEELAELDKSAGFTWFEFMTLLACRLFTASDIDLAVFEAGLGGKYDATTALSASFRCLTPIAMDHAAVIGPTIRDIASDKAGAIGWGDRVFSQAQFPAVCSELRTACLDKSASLVYTEPLASGPVMRGAHQLANAGLALECWRAFASWQGIESAPELESGGLANAFMPGRMQWVAACPEHPDLILDGGHNPHAIANLLAQLPEKPGAVIFSALKDKDWRSSLAMLSRTGARLIIVELGNERAESASRMVEFANSLKPGSALECGSIGEALAACATGPVLVCGSLYLLAAFYNLYPQYLNKT